MAALLVLAALIQGPSQGCAASSAPVYQSTDPIVEYFEDWKPRVSLVRSEQPENGATVWLRVSDRQARTVRLRAKAPET